MQSTLGAGDVFHGALVAAVVRGLPLAEQLAFANVTAALSCRGLDGRSRIPRPAEVLATMARDPARDTGADQAIGSTAGAAAPAPSDTH